MADFTNKLFSNKYNTRLICVLLALLIGVAFRLWFYLLFDSFWRDESKILLNIANKSFLSLLWHLDYEQEMPIPLLWFFRFIYILGARSELYIRAISLITNILSLCFFSLICYLIFFDAIPILISILLFSLSPGIIIFASIAKQYSLDIFVASVLLYQAVYRINNNKCLKPDYYLFLTAGLAPWFSYPAIFITLAIGVALFIKNYRKDIWLPIIYLLVTGISFAFEWLIILRRSLPMMKRYHAFLDLTNWKFLLSILHSVFNDIFFAYTGPNITLWLLSGLAVVASLSLMGLIEAWRQGLYPWLIVLVLPILLALGASAMNHYPLYGRTLIFAAPGVYLLVGYGLVLLLRKSKQKIFYTFIAAIILLILIVPCLNETIASYTKPVGGIREALKFISDHKDPEDLVICDSYSAPTIIYYQLIKQPYAKALTFRIKLENLIEGKFNISEFDNLCNTLPVNRRLWVMAETEGYQREKYSSVLFNEKMRRFIGRAAINHYWISDHWRKFINNLKVNRNIITKYVTERVIVYEFDYI
jgi:hypothetical protein